MQEMTVQLAAGHAFFYAGPFERGEKFYYDLARKLRGPPDEVKAQLNRIHGIRILASSKMNPEFSTIVSAKGQVAFRFSDLLFWKKHEMGDKAYSIEHVQPDDAEQIRNLNNEVVEPELHMSKRQVQEWIAANPRSLVARDETGRIAGFIFVSLIKLSELPWSYQQMTRAHDPIHQSTRDTMVDFWVVGNPEARGLGRSLPAITREMAAWMGPHIRSIIAYSRPAELEESLIRDEFEKTSPGESWAQYLELRRSQNRLRKQSDPALPYAALFEPGLDIPLYIEERFLQLTSPNPLAAKDDGTGATIGYEEYVAKLNADAEILRKYPGLDDSRESWEIFTAPRGVDAYQRFKQSYEQRHARGTLTTAEFCRLTGRVPEARVLIGVHETAGAKRSGIFFEGRPEDARSLAYNYLMFLMGNPEDLMQAFKAQRQATVTPEPASIGASA